MRQAAKTLCPVPDVKVFFFLIGFLDIGHWDYHNGFLADNKLISLGILRNPRCPPRWPPLTLYDITLELFGLYYRVIPLF